MAIGWTVSRIDKEKPWTDEENLKVVIVVPEGEWLSKDQENSITDVAKGFASGRFKREMERILEKISQ